MKFPASRCPSARSCCSCSRCSSRCRGSARVRARARARAARRAGAHAGGDRAGGGHRTARPAAAVRRCRRIRSRRSRASAPTTSPTTAAVAAALGVARNRADHRGPVAHDRAHLGDRSRRHRARARRARSSRQPRRRRAGIVRGRASAARRSAACTRWCSSQPSEDFSDDAATHGAPRGRDVEGALAGILTTDRRPTSDGKAVIVSAAHPVWVGDQVRGVVIAEETGNAVLAERNRAFERLFNIVLAVLLVGSLALTAYATWLSSRIRRLRDDAERAIDDEGRVRGAAGELGRRRRDRRPVAQLLQRAGAAVRIRELPGEDGEPAVARAAHADRRRALLARQPQGDAAAGRCARLHGACAGRPRAAHADPHADDRGRAPRAKPVRRRARALRPRAGGARAASRASALGVPGARTSRARRPPKP